MGLIVPNGKKLKRNFATLFEWKKSFRLLDDQKERVAVERQKEMFKRMNNYLTNNKAIKLFSNKKL